MKRLWLVLTVVAEELPHILVGFVLLLFFVFVLWLAVSDVVASLSR